ncbi:hypothetical protein QTP88_028039 [Uroleucon formosanum]
MYELPTLLKTAYYNCNQIERNKFDLINTPDVNLQQCCESLFLLLKIDRKTKDGNERETMFVRSVLPYKRQRFLDICQEAASHGHINCLKLAHEIGVPWDQNTCLNAASKGHLDCLIYARENGCPWYVGVCNSASMNGHKDCLVYARENGCPSSNDAATGGHYDCLVYAHEGGCEWNSFTYINALRYNHPECVEYALKNGCPQDVPDIPLNIRMGSLNIKQFMLMTNLHKSK